MSAIATAALTVATVANVNAARAEGAARAAQDTAHCSAVLAAKPDTVPQLHEFARCVEVVYPAPQMPTHQIDFWALSAVIWMVAVFVVGCIMAHREAIAERRFCGRYDWFAWLCVPLVALTVGRIILVLVAGLVWGLRVSFGLAG